MHSFTVRPYGQRVQVTTDPAEYARIDGRYTDPRERLTEEDVCKNWGLSVHRVRDKSPYTLFLIYIAKEADIFTVMHESVHMAHEIMEFAGVPITYENTEVVAYLVEDITRKTLQAACRDLLKRGQRHEVSNRGGVVLGRSAHRPGVDHTLPGKHGLTDGQ